MELVNKMWIKLNKKLVLFLGPETKGIVGNITEHKQHYWPVYTRDAGWIWNWKTMIYYQEIKYYMPGELLPKWIKVHPHIKLQDGKFKTLSPYVLKKENLCNYKIYFEV